MWCAECGGEMSRRMDGAWNPCCHNYGYWTTDRPLKADRWWPVLKYARWYFYPGPKWPARQLPTPPIIPHDPAKEDPHGTMAG